jgi:hypothetical protein
MTAFSREQFAAARSWLGEARDAAATGANPHPTEQPSQLRDELRSSLLLTAIEKVVATLGYRLVEIPAPQPTLSPGDRVLYRGSWSHAQPVLGTIVGEGEEGGTTVYDVQLDNGIKHWGYPSQFEHADPRTQPEEPTTAQPVGDLAGAVVVSLAQPCPHCGARFGSPEMRRQHIRDRHSSEAVAVS